MTKMPFIRVHARVFRIQIRMWYTTKESMMISNTSE